MYVMETILDHNMTEEERHKIIGWFSDEDFLYGLDENSSNHLLAKLYLLRNDEKKMMEYVNKLPVNMKYEFMKLISPLD